MGALGEIPPLSQGILALNRRVQRRPTQRDFRKLLPAAGLSDLPGRGMDVNHSANTKELRDDPDNFDVSMREPDPTEPAQIRTREGRRLPAFTNFLDYIRLCLPSVKATRGPARPCGTRSARERIETTSCAVGAEGHLNAKVMVEVVTTFSSFQVS
jgi:hypothetical protein